MPGSVIVYSCLMKTLLLLAALGLVACGGDDNNGNGDGGGNDATSGGDSPFGNKDGSGPNDGSQNGDSCYAPVDMYIMHDRSGSMGSDCNIGDNTNSKWCHAINALSGYFNSTAATGNAAAIQFFPLPNQRPRCAPRARATTSRPCPRRRPRTRRSRRTRSTLS